MPFENILYFSHSNIKNKIMKQKIALLLISLITLKINAQNNVEEPTVPLAELEFNYQQGKLFKTNGDSLTGLIYYSMLHDKEVLFKAKDGEKPQKFTPQEVSRFELNNGLGFYSKPGYYNNEKNDLRFYKKINSEKKIQLFSMFLSKGIGGTTIISGAAKGSYQYAVEILGKAEFSSDGSKTYRPFDEKVSVLLSDCSVLSKKIADKEKGYKTTMFNPAINVWKKTATEYETCK